MLKWLMRNAEEILLLLLLLLGFIFFAVLTARSG